MNTGWKAVISSFSLETSGMVSAIQTRFTDFSYNGGGCNGAPDNLFRVNAGNGHVVASWTAVADPTGGEIAGPGYGIIPTNFSGVLHFKITDANGGLIVNKTYSKKDMVGGGDAVTDFTAILVDVATYDPNTPQYATLSVEVSWSGKLPMIDYGYGEASWLGC